MTFDNRAMESTYNQLCAMGNTEKEAHRKTVQLFSEYDRLTDKSTGKLDEYEPEED